MKKYVIDASVVLKAVLSEDNSVSLWLEKAFESQVLSLDFLKLEVANGIRFTVGEGRKGSDFLKKFLRLPIEYTNLTKNRLSKTLELSYQMGTTVYDTGYHVLAIAENAILVTGDKKYYEKAKGLKNIEYVGKN